MKPRHWGMLSLAAAIVAAVAIVGGVVIASSSDEDDAEEVATESTATADGEEAEPAESGDGASDETTEDPAATAAPESDLPLLTFEFGPLPEDTYRVEIVGTPFSVTIDTPVWQFENTNGFLALGRGSSEDVNDLDLVFMELTRLWDPEQPEVALTGQGAGWPADDFAGWLDNLPEWMIVSDRQETTVGGFDAIRVDLELGEVECVELEPICIGFGMSGSRAKGITADGMIRVWVIDQGGEAPIAVIGGIWSEDDIVWFDSVDAIVASVSFDDA